MRTISTWKQSAKRLKSETYALYLALKHPQVPWYAKILVAFIVAYAFSPIDLIPDFIPVLGYVDDLIIIPGGVWLVLKLIPRTVFDECRMQAQKSLSSDKPVNYAMAVVIVLIWISLVVLGIVYARRIIEHYI